MPNSTRTDTPLSVAVFCGSRYGAHPAYRASCAELGRGLAASGIRLVYGGGQVGLMGVVADAVIAGGGEVLGIIPEFLQRREVAHQGPVALVVTDTMHDRKRQMFAAADAFVAMPGGLGTFDETIEITTWRQLGLHNKPILVCDVEGWAGPYLALLEAAVAQGFAAPETARLYDVVADVPSLLERLATLTRSAPGQPERV
jgi:uncharacterized protein (TIGR00730 family)